MSSVPEVGTNYAFFGKLPITSIIYTVYLYYDVGGRRQQHISNTNLICLPEMTTRFHSVVIVGLCFATTCTFSC